MDFTRISKLFKPYKGGAGPTTAQVHNNNLALYELLKAWKFSVKFVMSDLDGSLDHKIEVIQVEINNAKYTVSYDRWGYVCDQMADFDQCSIGQAVGHFLDIRCKNVPSPSFPIH